MSRVENDTLLEIINLKYQLDELNKKFDEYFKRSKAILNCRSPDHVWSIEFKNNNFIIKYIYNKEFAEWIKNINIKLYWDKYLLGWVAEKQYHEEVFFNILNKFPEWECIDKRT